MTVFSQNPVNGVDSLGVSCVIALLVLLILKEFATSSESEFALALQRVLTSGIVSLLIAFVLIVVVRIGELQ